MKFKATIFDFYGTVVEDFGSASVDQLQTEFLKALEVPAEPFMKLWRETTEQRVGGAFQTVEASIEHVCDLLAVKLTPERLKRAMEIRLQIIRQTLKPKADAVKTLSRLKQKGYKIGLLSNCSIEIPILWQETEFAPLVDSAVFSSRECLKKPDLRMYRLACERLHVTPCECLYVADGENYELAAAAQAGLHPILIRNPAAQKRPELFKEATEWQGRAVSELSEVLKIVDAGIEQEQYS
jgi:putative hydrolase of the HAD superfamily